MADQNFLDFLETTGTNIIANKPAMSGQLLNKNKTSGDTSEPNVLGKYASFNYIWTLSALSRGEIRNPKNIKEPHDVIAKSSGIGRDGEFSAFNTSGEYSTTAGTTAGSDLEFERSKKTQSEKNRKIAAGSDKILRRGHDIFFEKVVMTAVHRPNEQRKLMNFTKLDIEMSEPYGVTLFEKMRAAAFNNNFLDHIDAPYLLTLQFRGYDNLGQPQEVITKRLIPIRITNAEMEINAGGTQYTLTAVPWTEFAMIDRYLYTRSSGSIGKSTLNDALAEMSQRLNEQQDIEIQKGLREYKDVYEIDAAPGIFQLANDSINWKIWTGGIFNQSWRPNVSIAQLIKDVAVKADGYRNINEIVKKYWKDLESFSSASDGGSDKEAPDPLVPWFKIITTVDQQNEFDRITKMHKKTVKFRVIPYKVHVMNFTVPGISASGLWGKKVRKVYKYIYTGENTEILDLKINYKMGYFLARLMDGSGADGQFKKTVKDLSLRELVEKYGRFSGGQLDSLQPLRGFPTTVKTEDVASEKGASRTQVDEFYEYLTNPLTDMMHVQMTILGDPAFIGQDFALPMQSGNNTAVSSTTAQAQYDGKQWDEKLGCFNFDQAEPFVTLNFKFPTDINEKKGVMDFQSLENVQFNGLYKVVSVESTFDRGKFTQMLDLVRYNNQDGAFTPLESIKDLEKRASEAISRPDGEVRWDLGA